MKIKEYINEALTALNIKGEWQDYAFILEKDFIIPKKISRLVEYIGTLVDLEITVIDNNLAISFSEEWLDE